VLHLGFTSKVDISRGDIVSCDRLVVANCC